MTHSVLAVLAGFIVMALVVMITTALAVRLVLQQPVSAMRALGPTMQSRAYLATNLFASGIAALVGGYTTAAIAGHAHIVHGLGLAAVMVAMSLVSMRQAGAAQPRWYRVVLATAMPALAVAGAALCAAVAATA